MKNILIIEDEMPSASRLCRMIKELRPQASTVGILGSAAESVEWLKANESPHLIMMDVRLGDGTSFEIFEKVKITCPVIFTTAYDEYAVKAFKYNSVDYLLKPIEQDELEQALLKAEKIQPGLATANLESLLQNLTVKDYRSRFLLPYRDGYKTLLVTDINYFYSEQRITRAQLSEGKHEIIPQTLEELELQLDPKQFFRANRQYIVHINSIKQIHNYFNGKLKIELKKNSEEEVIVSRERAISFKTWLDS